MKPLRFILTLVLCITGAYGFGQPTVLGTQAVNGAYTTYNLTDYGIFRQVRLQASSSAGAGIRNWEFCQGTAASPDYTTNWRPYSGACNGNPNLTIPAINQTILYDVTYPSSYASAPYNTGSGGCSGYLTAITANRYYTFNISEDYDGTPPSNEYMGVLQTTYNPVAISSVTQLPGIGAVYPENSVYVTVTLAAAPSAGEYVYVRYSTTINFSSSTLLPVTITGITGTVEIPCMGAGNTVYYYAYTSNRTSATILADVVTNGQVAHDMSTLSINNNGGPNYIYTVLPSIGYCGSYYVPSTCYPTISSFVTALNGGTVSCSVTCYVAAGHTETAPVGGINLTQTGTAANTITFIKNGAGANPIIYAQTGTVSMTGGSTSVDGIFSFNGSDYITIDGIDLFDNNAVSPGTMEYGYALFKASAANGCQNNTIRNCAITLKASNTSTGPSQFENGSKGIFSGNITRTALTSTLTIASTAGRNDNNTFTGNTIKNVHHGIVIRGYYDQVSPYSYYDQNNTVGASGAGNIIENYGSAGSSAVYGIYVIYQNDHHIEYNSVNNTASGGTASSSILYGIFNASNTTTSIAALTLSNNTVALTQGSATSAMYAIKSGSSSGHQATTINISNNTIQNCSFSVSSSGTFRGIDQVLAASTITISGNLIQNNTLSSTAAVGINDLILINNNTSTPNNTITNNQILNNSKTGNSTASLYGYYNNGTPASGTETITGNTIYNLSVLSGSVSSAVGIRATTATAQVKNVNSNSVSKISGAGGTSVFTSGIIVDGMPAGSTVNNNIVQTVSSTSNVSGIQCTGFNAIATSSNQSVTVSNNSVSDVSTSVSGSNNCVGIAIYATTSATCSNNQVDSIITYQNVVPNVRGISIGGGSAGNTVIVSNSRITEVGHHNTSGTSIPTGIYLFPTSANVEIYNNSLSGILGNGSSDQVIGVYATSGSVTYTIYNNFLQRFSAPNSTANLSVNGIYVAAGGSTYNVSFNTIALGQDGVLTGASGFGVTGVYHGAGLMNLRNNIVYVNANPSGVGVASCVRRGTAGTAGTPPVTTSLSASTNRNYYYLNFGANNYIYVEGATTSTIRNGYAWSGATTSVANNLNNDPCFNILTAGDITSYKYFMSLGGGGSRENGSYYDVPPFVGGAVLPDNLKLTPGATTYAESNAVAIAGITTDYEGDARAGSPDIGADEGAFVVQDASCNLLPIELIAFTGWHNGAQNELHWTTATEINSDYFSVEKSIDGVSFVVIGEVDAADNSLDELDYLFLDDDPLPGINYYRLRMVDNDATFEYSNIIALRADAEGESMITIYPNPASEILHLSISSEHDQMMIINICDMPGRRVMSKQITLHDGENACSFDIRALATAPYLIYAIDASGNEQVLKFVKK